MKLAPVWVFSCKHPLTKRVCQMPPTYTFLKEINQIKFICLLCFSLWSKSYFQRQGRELHERASNPFECSTALITFRPVWIYPWFQPCWGVWLVQHWGHSQSTYVYPSWSPTVVVVCRLSLLFALVFGPGDYSAPSTSDPPGPNVARITR